MAVTITFESPATLTDEYAEQPVTKGVTDNIQDNEVLNDDQSHLDHAGEPGGPDESDAGAVIDTTDETDEPGVIAVPPGHAEERAKHDAAHHDDEAFWRECELIGELAQASRECSRLELVLNELSDERKEAKKEYEVSLLRLRSAAAAVEGMADKMPVRQATKQEGDQAEPSDTPFDQNAWRETATRELLSGVKGLGAKKLDAIVDLAPTAGHLEDLRAEASRGHKSFKEVLPKGCGQNIADAIEDRLVEHVAKMGTPPAHLQVEPRAEVDHKELMEGLANHFRKRATDENWTIEDCDEPLNEGERIGMEAFEKNEPVWSCTEPSGDWSLDAFA